MTETKKKVLGVIPARLGSTRIPKKMLKDICGKTLIQRTIERTKESELLDGLIVTTDSEEIARIAESLGVSVIMTDTDIPTGTDRVAAAVELFSDFEPDIVVNVWGDEPLFPSSAIDRSVQRLIEDDGLQVVAAADRFTDEKMLHEDSIVQVLTDINDNALLFSRTALPYLYTDESIDYYHVIGLLAMTRSFLKTLLTLPRTPIEACEGVEQMRILEHGYRMGIVKGDFNNLGVNMPAELEVVREIYKQREGLK